MPADETYKIGDTVKLKSGGPNMTIDILPTLPAEKQYGCIWFAGAKKERSYFHVDVVERVIIGKAKTSGS